MVTLSVPLSIHNVASCGKQRGDVMRDPEMIFEIRMYAAPDMAEPLSFRNDYMGLMQEVYRNGDDGKKTQVDARLKQELNAFVKTWFQNLKDQGFLGDTAIRERLT